MTVPAPVEEARTARAAQQTKGPKGRRTEDILRAFHEESAFGKAYDARLLAKLWPFLRPYRALLVFSMLVMVVTSAGRLIRPLVMLHTIDEGVLKGDPAKLFRGGLLIAGILIVEQGLSFAQVYVTQVLGARSMADLRRHVFRFLHSLRVGFFDNQPVGRLVTRVTNDVDAILELFASGALNALGDLITLVGIVFFMISLDFKLALIAFAAMPPVALLVVLVRKRAREAFREIRAKTARMNSTMNEQVAGMTVIQAFGRQRAAAEEFDESNATYRDANMRSIKYDALIDASIEMVAAVCMAAIVVSLGYRPVSLGTIVAFNVYLFQFFLPISVLAQSYVLLQSSMAGAERIFTLLEVDAADQATRPPKPAADSSLAFSFEQVHFYYKPGVPVFEDLNLSARRGETIALVGPTGSGKTTIASLLTRLYEAQRGVVRVHGQDVSALHRSELRKNFAVVQQDVFLFPGTVADNIAATAEPDRERVRRVIERIGALDVFERRGGIDAIVEERGANFSAGEAQLIAFARALYRDAPILILDEATASIDSETEARLQRALSELLRGRTALVIAHRLSTIRAADRIVVLQKGRVIEQGNHDELLAAGGLYAKLYDLQFSRKTQRWSVMSDAVPESGMPASEPISSSPTTTESSTRK
jgi:ATP-binding cassette subfamily B protein